jgi:predicted metal-dependent phosphoesterase TrpH
MKLKVDLHTHTSEDPVDVIGYSAFQLIDKACELGYDAIALANHDRVTENPDILAYAAGKGLLLIPAMEATLSQKHVLIINPAVSLNPKGSSLDDLPARISSDSLVIAPHPFFPQSKSLKSSFHDQVLHFHAVEYSHFYTTWFNWNKEAEKQAKKYGLPLVGTSDCHLLWEFGTTYALVEAEKNIPAIIHAVKQGRIELCTSPLSNLQIAKVLIKLFRIKFGHMFRSFRRRA